MLLCVSLWPYTLCVSYTYSTIQPICAESAVQYQPTNLCLTWIRI